MADDTLTHDFPTPAEERREEARETRLFVGLIGLALLGFVGFVCVFSWAVRGLVRWVG